MRWRATSRKQTLERLNVLGSHGSKTRLALAQALTECGVGLSYLIMLEGQDGCRQVGGVACTPGADADVERVITLTLETTPQDATSWSTRSMAVPSARVKVRRRRGDRPILSQTSFGNKE